MATQDDAPTRQQDDFFTVLGNTFRLIGKSWEALQLNLGTFLLVGLVPVALLLLSVLLPFGLVNMADPTVGSDSNTSAAANAGLIVIGLLLIVAILWATIGITIAQLASVRGQKISFKEVLDASTPFLFRVLVLGIATVLIVALGLILLIVPGILAAFFLSFAIYVMLDKNAGVIDSIKGSYELVKQNWKLVLAYYIVSIVISIPQVVPVLGVIASLVLSIAYFCLPAILYVRAQKTPAAA